MEQSINANIRRIYQARTLMALLQSQIEAAMHNTNSNAELVMTHIKSMPNYTKMQMVQPYLINTRINKEKVFLN